MKILSLGINNFKQFVDAEFNFESQSESSPFALIVGSNGAGKTTLLSALFFAFHGDVLASLDDPKHLLNRELFNSLQEGEEASLTVWVRFSSNSNEYTVQRNLLIRRNGDSETRLDEDLDVFNHTENIPETPPQMWLNRVFPANLARFLFFPGEQLEDFFNPTKFAAFVNDIKTLSGLDRLDLLQSAIASTIQRIDKRIKSIPGDSEIKKLMESLGSCEKELGEYQEELAKSSAELSRGYARQEELASILKSRSNDYESLKDAETLRSAMPQLERDVKGASADLTKLYANYGWISLAASVLARARKTTEALDAVSSGHRTLPDSVVESILANDVCICGRKIGHDTEAAQTLRRLVESPERRVNLPAYLDVLDATTPGGLLDVEAVADAIVNQWDALEDAETKLTLAHQKLSEISRTSSTDGKNDPLSLALQEIVELDQRLPLLDEKVRDLRVKVNGHESKRASLLAEVSSNLTESETHGALIRRRESLARISHSFESDAADMRRHIQDSLRQMLTDALPPIFNYQNFEVHVDEHFRVVIMQNGRAAAMSEGQRKSISFAIIASLTKLASTLVWKDKDSGQTLDHAYPLVIDAGFAELSEYFSQFSLAWLKEATSQVILIALHNIGTRLIEIIPRAELSNLYLLRLQFETSDGEDEKWKSPLGEIKVRTFGAEKNCMTIERLDIDGFN